MTTRENSSADLLGHELSLRVVLFHDAIARKLGVNATEHKILDLISHRPGMKPSDIASHSGLSNAAVTKIIDRLVSMEYVERERDQADKRAVRIVLNEGYARQMWPYTRGLANRILKANESFTEVEIDAITKWLSTTIDALSEETKLLNSQ